MRLAVPLGLRQAGGSGMPGAARGECVQTFIGEENVYQAIWMLPPAPWGIGVKVFPVRTPRMLPGP